MKSRQRKFLMDVRLIEGELQHKLLKYKTYALKAAEEVCGMSRKRR